jgi:hypothetical protein
MTVKNVFAAGDAVSPSKINENFAEVDANLYNIMGDQINPNAGIPATAVDGTLATSSNLQDDINTLNGQLSAFAGQQLGGYNPWMEMLPVIGATPISASGTTDLKVTIAAGGTIKMLGHNFVTKGVTALGTDGKANGVAMDAESVYALRLTSGAPPAGESAHVQEGGVDTLAVHFELVKLTASRFIRDTVSSVTSSTVFTFNNANLQGARVRFLNGTLANTEFTVPWTSGSTVYLAASVGGSPAVGDKVLINLDSLSVRNAETPGTLAGASSPTSAFIAIVATMASGVAPAIILQQNRGGTYNYGRSLIAETDWSADLTNDGTEHTLAWTRPVDGARLKSLSGWVALADHSVPSRVALRPLFSASVLDGTLGWANGNYAEVIRYSGLEVRLLGDGIGVSSHFETWPSGDNPGDYSESRWYTRVRVKVIAEYMP